MEVVLTWWVFLLRSGMDLHTSAKDGPSFISRMWQVPAARIFSAAMRATTAARPRLDSFFTSRACGAELLWDESRMVFSGSRSCSYEVRLTVEASILQHL